MTRYFQGISQALKPRAFSFFLSSWLLLHGLMPVASLLGCPASPGYFEFIEQLGATFVSENGKLYCLFSHGSPELLTVLFSHQQHTLSCQSGVVGAYKPEHPPFSDRRKSA